MKKVESVWAELSAKKEALSSGKLELNAVDDINDEYFRLEKAIGEAYNAEEDVYGFTMELEAVIEKGRELTEKMNRIKGLVEDHLNDAAAALDQYDRLANELGVRGEENESYRNLRDLADDQAMDVIGRMDMYIDDIKSIKY